MGVHGTRRQHNEVPWGDKIDSSKAKYKSKNGSKEGPVPVGDYSANAFGVYDTAGNLYEWVEDCWHEDYKDAPSDGSAWLSASGGDCEERVIRGGSWIGSPRKLLSASRFGYGATWESWTIGFRIARTLSQ